ncbi:MAG: DUF4200 domain-containing protein [Magnetococcales bacterium]|nr:DUF4200 domain-containing protein [Magnetococcales bacterium]
MNTLTNFPIFQAGRHQDISGTTVSITKVELDKTASAYQPTRHEAPLVIGHPQDDAPAWGWVSKLSVKNATLQASVQQVDPAFRQIVQAGRYKKVSASFYTPTAANNPVPGTYYLRHVGFLGAQPPAIKGLGDVSFNEAESGVLTFSGAVDLLTTQQPSRADFSETPSTEENTMKTPQKPTPPNQEELTRRQKELDEREEKLTRREEAVGLKEQENRKGSLIQFVDQLIKEGRILPRDREGLLALMDKLKETGIIEFSEAGAAGEKVTSEAVNYLQSFMARLPVQVAFAETTPQTDHTTSQPSHYTTPRGYQVDPDGLNTHQKILAYAKTRDIDYLTAALTLGQ